MVEKKENRVYKLSIFDLIFNHYASTEEGFINYFGRVREMHEETIQSIGAHALMAIADKRALVGRYDGLPQLVVWNDKELFFVSVKSKDEEMSRKEIDFLKEYVLEKALFRVKIFKVIERQKKAEPAHKPVEKRPEPVEPPPKPVEKPPERIELPPPVDKKEITKEVKRSARRPFTQEEISFLTENRDKFTNEKLAEKLERSLDSVTHKLSRLNIGRQSYEWTEEKDDFLSNNISSLTYRELAEKLGTTIPSVRARCKKMDIKK